MAATFLLRFENERQKAALTERAKKAGLSLNAWLIERATGDAAPPPKPRGRPPQRPAKPNPAPAPTVAPAPPKPAPPVAVTVPKPQPPTTGASVLSLMGVKIPTHRTYDPTKPQTK